MLRVSNKIKKFDMLHILSRGKTAILNNVHFCSKDTARCYGSTPGVADRVRYLILGYIHVELLLKKNQFSKLF